ncbi:MAG: hypothetical protein IJX76_10160 [Clostridia bacterium]|nr:hypothetical protein [Clostridia bacterium]
MKRSAKLLSLLTAGLLTLSLLAACGDADDGNEITTVTTQTGDPVTYEGLTPAQVYDTLLQTEDFVFITVMNRQVTGATISMTYMLEKDDNTLRYTVHQDAEDDTYDVSSVIYIDLKEGICIAPDGDEWYVLEQSGDISVAALVENCTPADLLFDNGNYSVSGGKYTLTKDAILTIIGSTTATVSGKMISDGDTYTFDVVTKEAGNTVTMTTKVIFRNVGVDMPEYSPGAAASGSAATDEGEQEPEAPVTEVPEENENVDGGESADNADDANGGA